jgi:hypothetical protein
MILCYNVLTICSAKNRLALKIWNTFVLQLEDEVNEMVLEPVYLTEKLRYIIQMFGSLLTANSFVFRCKLFWTIYILNEHVFFAVV